MEPGIELFGGEDFQWFLRKGVEYGIRLSLVGYPGHLGDGMFGSGGPPSPPPAWISLITPEVRGVSSLFNRGDTADIGQNNRDSLGILISRNKPKEQIFFPAHAGTLSSLEGQVWEKGRPIRNADPSVWRTDDCGALMNRDQYGNQTEFGWEIDHMTPQAKDGTTDISNLRPLHWLNNHSRKEDELTCPAVWERTHNVVKCKNCDNSWYPTTNSCPKCGTSA